MAFTLTEIQELRRQGKYRETISAVNEWRKEHPGLPDAAASGDSDDVWSAIYIEEAWALYQLGEFNEAEKVAMLITGFISARDGVGESARRLLAHCAERRGELQVAESYLRELSPSSVRDNLLVTILVRHQRNGEIIDAPWAMELAQTALGRTPHQTVDGHIINNVAWLLYGARKQEGVKPFLPILSGLIEAAIGIYEATGTALNHRAGALFRASHIFLDVADWPKGALVVINESIAFWEQLVASEGGQRYQQNLEGARAQREKILARLS